MLLNGKVARNKIFLKKSLRHACCYAHKTSFSPVNNKDFLLKFDGAEITSDASVILLPHFQYELQHPERIMGTGAITSSRCVA